jgi:hypothetical protein
MYVFIYYSDADVTTTNEYSSPGCLSEWEKCELLYLMAIQPSESPFDWQLEQIVGKSLKNSCLSCWSCWGNVDRFDHEG